MRLKLMALVVSVVGVGLFAAAALGQDEECTDPALADPVVCVPSSIWVNRMLMIGKLSPSAGENLMPSSAKRSAQ